MVLVSAPGKLMLAGEWAVLELGNPCIVAAVNRRVFAEVVPYHNRLEINLPEFNIKDVHGEWDEKEQNIIWERPLTDKEKADVSFIDAALTTTLRYLGEFRPFKVKSWGEDTQIEIGGQRKKVGFGSSAAAVVAAVAGLLKFYGRDITTQQSKETIYKLATIAHFFAQGKAGSAFDVAASTFGGATAYTRFDPVWLTKKMEAKEDIRAVCEQEWPGFSAESLSIPEGFHLWVAWTGDSASTSTMIKQMNAFKEGQRQEYDRLYRSIGSLVQQAVGEWKRGNKKDVISLLNKNQQLLAELSQKSGVPILTPQLQQLAEIAQQAGAAGKLSGAGGGDCGIAISFSETWKEDIIASWKAAGLWPLDVTIDRDGVREEK